MSSNKPQVQPCKRTDCFMQFIMDYCQKNAISDQPCPYEKMFSDEHYPAMCICECEQCTQYVESEDKLVELLKKKNCTTPCPNDLEENIRKQVLSVV